jgi:hypothetical protein
MADYEAALRINPNHSQAKNNLAIVKREAEATKSGSSASGGSSSSGTQMADKAVESDFSVSLTADSKGVAITGYTGKARDVVIPATIQGMPVIEITKFAFNSNITSLVIPEGVIAIKGFDSCSYLTSVTLPSTIREIGSTAFIRCSSLQTVNIPRSVTEIKFGFSAFTDCPKLSLATQAALRQLGYKDSF